MSAPYYRMFPREWDDGTAPLTLEQEGALLRICNAINSRGKPLPDDEAGDREMMHRCRVSMRKWKAIKAALVAAGKITVCDGQIHQDRALSEVDYRQDMADARAENGAKGGRKRAENALKTARKSPENESALAKNNDLDQAYPEPEPEPEDTNVSKKRARKRAERLPENWILPSEWIEDATSRGLSVEQAYDQGERMRDWSRSAPASKGAKLDWRAAWRNWIKRVCDDRGKPSGGGGGGNYADRQRAAADTAQSAAVRVAQRRMGWSDDHSARSSAHDGEPHLRVIDASDTGHGFGADRASGQALSATAAKRAGGGNVF